MAGREWDLNYASRLGAAGIHPREDHSATLGNKGYVSSLVMGDPHCFKKCTKKIISKLT